jgi:hypothetical protein
MLPNGFIWCAGAVREEPKALLVLEIADGRELRGTEPNVEHSNTMWEAIAPVLSCPVSLLEHVLSSLPGSSLCLKSRRSSRITVKLLPWLAFGF